MIRFLADSLLVIMMTGLNFALACLIASPIWSLLFVASQNRTYIYVFFVGFFFQKFEGYTLAVKKAIRAGGWSAGVDFMDQRLKSRHVK